MYSRNFILLLFFSILLLTTECFASSWEKLFAKKSTDAFRSAVEVPTGGFIAAGYTADFTPNDTDAYVVRLSAQGDTLWTKTLNGPQSRKDLFYKVINTNNGFAFCGYSSSFNANGDEAYMVGMDDNGNITWQTIYGGPGRDRAQEIVQTADGGYIVCGYVAPFGNYSGFLLRLNNSGDTLWSKRFRATGSTYSDLNSVKELADGGYIACGQAPNGANGNDIYVIRTDASGNLLWSTFVGTPDNDNGDYILPADNGYVIAGGKGFDGYFVKTDTTGNKIWEKVFGGGTLNDDFHQVNTTFDGGYILAGTTSSYGPFDPNIWILKTDANGDSLWARTFGGDNHDHGYSAVQTADSGFIVSGYTSSFGFNFENAYVIRTDADGNLENYLTYGTIDTIVAPLTGSCAADSVRIVVTIRNFGRDTLYNVPLHVTMTGTINQTITDVFPGPLYPQDVLRDTLPALLDLRSGNCSLSITAVADEPNDVFPALNTISKSVTIVQPPSATGGSRCTPGSVTLSASACDDIYWYDTPNGLNILGGGTSFNTPAINNTTTFYAQSGLTCIENRVPVTATLLPVPNPGLGLGADTIYVVAPYSLSAAAGFLAYIWSTGNNTQSITVNTSGLYCVTVIDGSGCSGNDCIYVEVGNSTTELLTNSEIIAFPNPATQEINFAANLIVNNVRIELYNTTGELVLVEENVQLSNTTKHQIDLRDLTAGLYFVRITNDQLQYSLRFKKD